MNTTELTSTTPTENNTLELPFILASTVPPAPPDEPRMDVGDPGQTETAGDRPATIVNVVQVAIDDLEPHPTNAAVYGDEPVDEDLVASIKTLDVINPLHATVEHVIVDGHRRLKAARAAGLTMVPLIFLDPGHDALAIEELLLEANRSRNKNNEQRVREFAAYLRIESERAKTRMLKGAPVLKSTQGGGKKLAGKARDIAAKKVGWSWATAKKGLEMVTVLDRMLANGDPDAADLRKLLHDKKVEAAHNAAVSHGWIEGKSTAPSRQRAGGTESISRTPDENEQDVSRPFVPTGPAARSADSSQSPTVVAVLPGPACDTDPGVSEALERSSADHSEAGQVEERQSTDGLICSPCFPVPAVPSKDLLTQMVNTPLHSGTTFRLADGTDLVIASIGEDDLITGKKLRAILQISVSLGDKDAVGVEALTRRQMFAVSTTETMNRLGKAYPLIPAQRLWTEFCMANRIFQKQMKLN